MNSEMLDGAANLTTPTTPLDDVDALLATGETDLSQIVNVTREYPFDYAIVMFGYIMPFVLALTLVTNTLVVAVLAQRHMRTPTNIVLVSMAIVDSSTLLLPSPWYFYIYTLGNHDKFLHPSSWCYTHYIMTDVFPVFFHTSSIWLALLLASQRYIYVCHPTLARTWCTVPRVKKAIFLILLVAALHQASRFFDTDFTQVTINYEGRPHEACREDYATWVQRMDIALYYTTYFTFRILFVFVLPCGALITLNFLLFRALKRAENKRTQLLKTKFKLVGVGGPVKSSQQPPAPPPLVKRAAAALLPVANHHEVARELSLVNYATIVAPGGVESSRVAPSGGDLSLPIQWNGRVEKSLEVIGPCHAPQRDPEAGGVAGENLYSEEEEEESICAECAAYESACRRCSAELATTTANGQIGAASRPHHLPISQCSSILGQQTNTTNTTTNTNTNFQDEDNISSSCLANTTSACHHQPGDERDSSLDESDGQTRERRRSSGATVAIGSVLAQSADGVQLDGSGDGSRLACGCPSGHARKLKLARVEMRQIDEQLVDSPPIKRTRRATSDSSLRVVSAAVDCQQMHQSASTNSAALLQVQQQQQHTRKSNGGATARSLASSPAARRLKQQTKSPPSFASSTYGRTNSNSHVAITRAAAVVPAPSVAAVHQSVRTMDSNRTTLMLVVVVSVFLVVEVPVAIVTILHVVGNLFDLFHDDQIVATLNYIKLFTNFFIMISYSVNFTIYCSMSKKFRETFRDLFFCGRAAAQRKHQKRMLYQTQAQQQSQYVTHTANNAQVHVHQAGGARGANNNHVMQSSAAINRSRDFCLHAGNLSARARRNSFAIQNDTLATATTTLTWRTTATATTTPPTRAPATCHQPSPSSSASGGGGHGRSTPTNSSAHSSSSSSAASASSSSGSHSSMSSGSSGSSSSPRTCSSPPLLVSGNQAPPPPPPPTSYHRKSASGKMNESEPASQKRPSRRMECQL